MITNIFAGTITMLVTNILVTDNPDTKERFEHIVVSQVTMTTNILSSTLNKVYKWDTSLPPSPPGLLPQRLPLQRLSIPTELPTKGPLPLVPDVKSGIPSFLSPTNASTEGLIREKRSRKRRS